jgi:hypothetical protein
MHSFCSVLTRSGNVVAYSDRQIIVPRHARRKCSRQARGRITTAILAILQASHCVQLEVTELWDHNAYRKV